MKKGCMESSYNQKNLNNLSMMCDLYSLSYIVALGAGEISGS